MGKTWTDEERKAFGEKMKAAKAAKQQDKPIVDENTQTDVRNEDLDELRRRVDELTNLLKAQTISPPQPQTFTQSQPTYAQPQITSTGLIGTLHKFNIDPNYYPDPTERLAKEPKLSRFAFGDNWELEYSVKTTEYTTIDNRRISEPQFTVQLIGKIFDDAGEPTPGRYVRKQIIFFEDPDSALTVARERGLKPEDFGGEKTFLDEMRYLRIRDWLLENFYPSSNTQKRENKKQMVINNQVVEYFEVSSPNSSELKFNELDGKLKG